jgi:hypothetical protein
MVNIDPNQNYSDIQYSFDRRETLSLPHFLKNCIAPMKPCYEDENFSFIAKECYIYSFLEHQLNELGQEFISCGVKVKKIIRDF